MREFKFRAWNITHEQYCDQGFEGQCFEWAEEGQDFIIEQFTGLQDKDGVDIYEGDIVSSDFYEPEIHEIAEVMYSDVLMRFALDSAEQDAFEYGNLEVIGNIHENKGLLK